MTAQPISWGQRISTLAADHPEKPALIFASFTGEEQVMSWRELNEASNRQARLMAERGLDEQSLVVLAMPNCLDHYTAAYAAWKLGALVLPTSVRLPERELTALLAVGKPRLVVGDVNAGPWSTMARVDLHRAASSAPLPEKVPNPGKAIGSGGSTGRPKIIVEPGPWARVPGDLAQTYSDWGFRSQMVQLVGGALYHNSPFTWSHFGLFEDHTLILMEKFDPVRAVDLIEKYRVQYMYMAPIMMQRISRLPDVAGRDFSSVETLFHTAAPCPAWLKRDWIDRIGAESVYEAFGATENVGVIGNRGDEWLQAPGTLGKPRNTLVKILDEHEKVVSTGEVGEIFMKPVNAEGPSYQYIGEAPARTTEDGYVSVGDLGYVDQNGWYFLADRRVDMIVSGGANVYPAEVEAALTEHPSVADAVVVGVPDAEWGKRVHAVVQLNLGLPPVSARELNVYCRERLVPYKAPKSYEFVQEFPRDPSGKVRRSAVAAERSLGQVPGMVQP